MALDAWRGKLDAYFDGELSADDARALAEHLRQCPTCAADGMDKLQLKRAIGAVGQRFAPDPEFRARMQKRIAGRTRVPWTGRWLPALVTVTAMLLVSAVFLAQIRETNGDQQMLSELADLHVATLASPNPVDVVSTDRHTVKPWFEGKIPFTFNLPELQDSPFELLGGKVSYLNQSPGAELIFRVRKHQISVFIFQERGLGKSSSDEATTNALSFTVRSWSRNGLRYFVIGDASPQDLEKLSDLLKTAATS
jgi:anti-sigma factor RsiW